MAQTSQSPWKAWPGARPPRQRRSLPQSQCPPALHPRPPCSPGGGSGLGEVPCSWLGAGSGRRPGPGPRCPIPGTSAPVNPPATEHPLSPVLALGHLTLPERKPGAEGEAAGPTGLQPPATDVASWAASAVQLGEDWPACPRPRPGRCGLGAGRPPDAGPCPPLLWQCRPGLGEAALELCQPRPVWTLFDLGLRPFFPLPLAVAICQV